MLHGIARQHQRVAAQDVVDVGALLRQEIDAGKVARGAREVHVDRRPVDDEGRGEAEQRYFLCIKAAILAYMQGYAPSVAVEFARKSLNTDVRPTFYEVEEAVEALPAAA